MLAFAQQVLFLVLKNPCFFGGFPCHFPKKKRKEGQGRGLLAKGSFQKSPCSRDSREFRDSRDFREPPNCGKQRRIRPFSGDSRESRDFRDSRDSSSEKTPFVMTLFPAPSIHFQLQIQNRAARINFRNARLFIILFCSQFLVGLFAILAECSQFCLEVLL